MDGGSKLLPSNGLGYMSTVKFAYNGKEFEFSTTEPESTKKKAEHKAADLCINAVEAKYKEKLRPDEQNKSTLAQVCKYGITDEKNSDSIALFNMSLGDKEFLPLGSLLYIRNIQTAINKQGSNDEMKNPQNSYTILKKELESLRNVIEEDPTQPLIHIQEFGIQTVVKPNNLIISSRQHAKIVEYKKKVTEEGAPIGVVGEINYVKVVFIPSTVASSSSSSSSFSPSSSSGSLPRIVITETELVEGNCLEMMEEMRRLIRTDNLTMSTPYKFLDRIYKHRSEQSISADDDKLLKADTYEMAAVKIDGAILFGVKNLDVKSSTDSLATQYSNMNITDTNGDEIDVGSQASASPTSNVNATESINEQVNTSVPIQERWRQKKGPRFFLPADPIGLAKNELVSWIVGSPCYGDAFFAFVEPTETCDVEADQLLNLIASFTPLGLLSTESPLFVIPKEYSAENFNRLGLHSPMAVLSELMAKRTNVSGTPCKPEISFVQNIIGPFKADKSGKQELGEGEYTLLRPIETFTATIQLPPMIKLDSDQSYDQSYSDSVFSSGQRPTKQDAQQAVVLKYLADIQEKCNIFLDNIHILKEKNGKGVLCHYPYSSTNAEREADESLSHIPRCFLADFNVSYVISEGYNCNNSTDKDVDDDDDDDDDNDNESVNENKLQPNLSAFEISTENEKILGSIAENIKYIDTLVGVGNLPFSIEMGLISMPAEQPPFKLAVAPIQVPPWWKWTQTSKKLSLQKLTVPAKTLRASLSEIISSAEVVDITMKAAFHLIKKKSDDHYYDALSDMKREASVQIFETPLSSQRHQYISNELKDITSLVDVGCGSGDYFLKCISAIAAVSLPSLTHLTGFDVNEIRVKKLVETINGPMQLPPSIKNVQLWIGSMLEKPFLDKLWASMNVDDLDAVACIEVIEHLPSIEDATRGTVNVLTSLQPRIGIFTTPNYEANLALAVAAKDGPAKNLKKQKFREADHKFEFTRNEFLSWINTVQSSVKAACPGVEYTFKTFEVGDLSKYSEGKTCGGASQGVMFTRSTGRSIITSLSQSQAVKYTPMMDWVNSP